MRELLFDVLLPQKDDVWHGRTHNDACLRTAALRLRSQDLFVASRLLHIVGTAVATYGHDDVV